MSFTTFATAGIGARRARRVLAALAAVAATGVVVSQPASAEPLLDDCGAQPLSQPFLPFLDPLRYTPVPDGGLEAGGEGWTLTGGAAVVAENEPWHVAGEGGGKALRLPAGSSATTPPVCIGVLHPTTRFFVRNEGLALAPLSVEVLFTDADGLLSSLPVGVVVASDAWQPTLPLPLLANLTTPLAGGTLRVQLRFEPLLVGGDWRVDDVFVDPYKVV